MMCAKVAFGWKERLSLFVCWEASLIALCYCCGLSGDKTVRTLPLELSSTLLLLKARALEYLRFIAWLDLITSRTDTMSC